MANFPGNARADESVNEIERKERRYDIDEALAENENQADNQSNNDCLSKRDAGAQSERLEARIFDGANHHRGEKEKNDGQKVFPIPKSSLLFVQLDNEK